MEQVGVRELRQNLSVYLRRVAAGESLEVTEHGRPVAVLAPLPDAGPLAGLIASGRLRPAERPFGDRPRPISVDGEQAGSRALAAMRDEER